MHNVTVKLGKRAYPVLVGSGILTRLGGYLKKQDIGTDAFIITNVYLKKKYGPYLERALKKSGFSYRFCLVADSERSKSIQAASAVIKELAKFDSRRRVFIVAFGGGVVGDLSGFVASVYKRGISYLQVPTTLLAQVDSAIGGKTAVDLDVGKNLVGAFYQPRLVLSEIDFIQSLDKRQFASGLAEVIKYALIKDKKLFEYLETNSKKILAKDKAALEKIILACSLIKAQIVSRDEKETRGLRTVLNFGHTIGHAIETAGGYRNYNHGQAVALGMIAALQLGCGLGLTGQDTVLRTRGLIKLYGLPVKVKSVSAAKIIRAHFHDKKFSGSQNKFVLIGDIGKPRIVCNIKLDLIKKAVAGLF